MKTSIQSAVAGAAMPLLASWALASCSQPTSGTKAPAPPSQPNTPTQAKVESPPNISRGTPIETEVSLEEEGGTFVVPVTINDTITLKFTVDSGASDVTIPTDVASTLIRSGTITRDDFIGTKTFVLADGTQVPSAEFRIRSLKIGTLVLHDVTGSLADPRGSLLLGQSFLTRLSDWSVDNGNHLLRLRAAPGTAQAAAQAMPTIEEAAAVTNNSDTSETIDAPNDGVLRQSVFRIAANYFSTWSDTSDPSGIGIRQYYAPMVNFYGKNISVSDLMAEKLAFAKRWPSRNYVPRTSSMVVRCVDTHTCTVSGIVDWKASDQTSGRSSSGVAAFSIALQDGLISSESSHVLARD